MRAILEGNERCSSLLEAPTYSPDDALGSGIPRHVRGVSEGRHQRELRGRSKCMLRRVSSLRKFSPIVSTEHCNRDESAPFLGPFTHLRQELDYQYHAKYRKERQWLQDSIIEDILEASTPDDAATCVTPTEPWLIFTVGPRGAGKKHVLNQLVREDRLPLLSHVRVDPGEIRRRLPEFDSYSTKNPCLVDDLTRKESGYIAEILMLAALQHGRNVIFDGSMSDPFWHVQLVQKLRTQYKSLKFSILHITTPNKALFERVQGRSRHTAKKITQDDVHAYVRRIEESVQIVKPVVDFYCKIYNGLHGPLELKNMSWDTFHQTFLQTCAWKPGMRGKQKLVYELTEEETNLARQVPLKRDRARHRRFSVLISSEENNRSEDHNFYGKFSHIRKTLDYSYHANYTFERQMLQDAIIDDMLNDAIILDVDGKIGSVPTEPWIVFTAGAMGAGKSHTMNVLVEKGRFPLQAFVTVDPDEIRHLLPEYHMYIDENPELAGNLTNKEAGFISEILTLAALQAGKNVLLDGSLRDADWYQIYLTRLRKEFPSVRQAILHVTAPREIVFQRAEERAKETGRVVPRELLETALDQVPRSVEKLAPLVDYYAELNNADEVELVKPEGSTWEDFRDVWNQ